MGRLRSLFLYFWNFRYLPLRYRWPLIKLRRRLLPTGTPLQLRYTVRMARLLPHPLAPNACLFTPPERNAAEFVARLLWPRPSWSLPAVRPPPPLEIVAEPERVDKQERDLVRLRTIPLYRRRDTAQRSLYRLYEALCADNGYMVTYESEYWWKQPSPAWALEQLADPALDDDPVQYAVLAAIVEVLVESFNWRLQLGLRRDGTMPGPEGGVSPELVERCPPWVAKVPPLPEILTLQKLPDSEHLQPDVNAFHRRNIVMCTGFFFTV